MAARPFKVRVFERQEQRAGERARPGVELPELALAVDASNCDRAAAEARAALAAKSPTRQILAVSHGRKDEVLVTVSRAS